MRKSQLFLLFWIAILLCVTIFFPQSFNLPYSYEADIIQTNPPKFLWHLANFDGAHYQNIARFGYLKKFHTAFFPLFPLTVRVISTLTHNYLLTGLFLSLICLLASTFIISKLTKTNKPLISLICFPLSFFLLTSYTESLFLLLALTTWWSYKQKRFYLTALAGLLASLTRFYGILLFPMILIDYLFSLRDERFQISSYLPVLPLLFMPFGLVVYMVYLQINYQDPLLFFHSLKMWQKSTIILPLQTLYRYLKIFTTVSANVWQYWVAVLEFTSFFFGLLVSYLFYRRRKLAFSFYVFAGTLIPSFTGTLQSLPRYLLVLFPIYLLADYLPKKVFIPLAISGFILQLILFTRFLTGHFVA